MAELVFLYQNIQILDYQLQNETYISGFMLIDHYSNVSFSYNLPNNLFNASLISSYTTKGQIIIDSTYNDKILKLNDLTNSPFADPAYLKENLAYLENNKSNFYFLNETYNSQLSSYIYTQSTPSLIKNTLLIYSNITEKIVFDTFSKLLTSFRVISIEVNYPTSYLAKSSAKQ